MKTCTKCGMVLDDSMFVRLSRSKDGLYPSCKACEKRDRESLLSNHPLCTGCKVKRHMKGSYYCNDCERVARGFPAKKWVSRRSGLEWCKICEQRPRLPYHQYCHECKMEYQRQHRATTWAGRHPNWQSRRKANARAYATGLLAHGKIKRGPCLRCGIQSETFHHLDYEDRTTNFQHLCWPCHLIAERKIREEKKKLTQKKS